MSERVPEYGTERHHCDGMNALLVEGEYVENAELYGHAVTDITRFLDGLWYAENGEYATRVDYCPFCGLKLP